MTRTRTLSTSAHDLPAALRRRPRALLLDFGGVVFETVKRADGVATVSVLLHDVLRRAGHDVAPEALARSLSAGLAGLKHWKHAMSRTQEPVELTHRQLWEDFLLADQAPAVRATTAGDGAELMLALNKAVNDHALRPGIRSLLDRARELGIPVGIVSNAHSGRAHRELMRDHGLDHLIAVQLYSDEAGIRKPHPGMIRQAAAALGAAPEHCWYVGDTQDRDLVAGRRANVGAVVLTRSKHTDSPPFPVGERADAVLDSPEGLLDLLTDAAPSPVPVCPAESVQAHTPGSRPGVAREAVRPRALLLDQGGVLTSSHKTPDAVNAFAARLAAGLRAAGHDLGDDQVIDAVRGGGRAYQAWKADGHLDEISPRAFWGDFVGAGLGLGAQAWLRAEAASLTFGYAQAKSTAQLRDGVPGLLAWCQEQRLPVAIVSNTISGRSGRRRLAEAGVDHLVGVHLYSDELGLRKPDPSLIREALRSVGVAAADCWFVGDKPWRDVAAARAAGVGTAVIVRSGSPAKDRLDAALADPDLAPDLVFDDMRAVHQELRGRHPPHLP